MAKDLHKLYKIIEHIGEGTISEIEKKISQEDTLVDDIKSSLGIDEELEQELNLDDILQDDLVKLTGVPQEGGEAGEAGEKPLSPQEKESILGEISGQIPQEDEVQNLDFSFDEEGPEQQDQGENPEEFTFEPIEEEPLSGEQGEEEGEVQSEEFDLSDFAEAAEETGAIAEEQITGEGEAFEGFEEGGSGFSEEGEAIQAFDETLSEPTSEGEDTFSEEKVEETSLDSLFGGDEAIAESPEFDLSESLPEETAIPLEEKATEAIQEEPLDFGGGELEEFEPEEKGGQEGESLEFNFDEIEENQENVLDFAQSNDDMIDLKDLEEVTSLKEEAIIPNEEVDLELSDDDLEMIKTTLKAYPIWLSKHIKNLILNDAFAPSELSTLLDMLITVATYKQVVNYLQNTLNIKISAEEEAEEKIYIPSTFEVVWPYVKWGGLSVFALLLSIALFYFYIYIPNQAKKYYKLGYEAIMREQITSAVENFNRATQYKLYPDWILRYAQEYINRKYYEMAIQISKDPGLTNFSDDIRFYFAISDANFEMKKYTESISDLEKLYSYVKFAKNPKLYIEIAKKYEKLGEYKQALYTYSDGVRTLGKRIEFYIGMMRDYVALGDLKSSMLMYDSIMKMNKHFIDNRLFEDYSNLLLVYDFDTEARDIIEKVIEKEPNYSPMYYLYAKYFIKRKLPDSAKAQLSKAENLILHGEAGEDLLPEIYNLQGEILLSEPDQQSQAENKFQAAIVENPTYAKPYYNLAKIYYFYSDEYKPALENLLKAEKNGYVTDYSEYMIGWIYYQYKDYTKALSRFIKLHDKYLDNIMLKFALGNTFIQLGQAELAVGYLQSVVSHWEYLKLKSGKIDINNPEIKNILINLASSYNNLGVAYYKFYEQTKNEEYANQALKYFIKSKEEYSWLNPNVMVNSEAYINSLHVLHPDVKRELLLMDNFIYFPKSIFKENE